VFDLGRTLVAAVERDSGATAIVDGQTRFTYGEWFARIRCLVGGFDRVGLGRGSHLAILLQNRWEMATIHWACQLAGVIATPLNWRIKGRELDYFIEDADAEAVIFEEVSEATVADSNSAGKIPRIAVGDARGGSSAFDDLLAAEPAAADPRAVADDVSLMLYTSGTTGPGKGVPRRHRAERAAALAHVAQNAYVFGERTLGVMPLYHTMGVRSLLAMTLISGCFVCVRRFEPSTARSLIEKERITNLYLVPTLYYDLIADDALAATDISSVRKIGFAGMPMTEGLLRRLDSVFKPELFVNHYGSSEVYTFTIDQNATRKPGSAGKAGLNQQIRVVKLHANGPDDLAMPMEEGQIIANLASDEAFEGYWKRPEANAKAIHEGWYFTGDVGYFDDEGDLFVTGRVDDMIISGGENVLPAEIESILSLHPAVAEVAVVGITDERWGQRVTAFIKRSGAVDDAALDAHCRQSALADFKRPRAYVFVKEIPKSPVGKILRRTLVEGKYEAE